MNKTFEYKDDNLFKIEFSENDTITYKLLRNQIDEINEVFEKFKGMMPKEYIENSELQFSFDKGSVHLTVKIILYLITNHTDVFGDEGIEEISKKFFKLLVWFAKAFIKKKSAEKNASQEDVKVLEKIYGNTEDSETVEIVFSNGESVKMEKWMYELISEKKHSESSKKLFASMKNENRNVLISTRHTKEDIFLDIDTQERLSNISFYEVVHKEKLIEKKEIIKGRVMINHSTDKNANLPISDFVRSIKIREFKKGVKPIFSGEASLVRLILFKHDQFAENPYMICDYNYKITEIANKTFCEVTITKIHSYHRIEIQENDDDLLDL